MEAAGAQARAPRPLAAAGNESLHSGQETCGPVLRCGPQSSRTRSGRLRSELVGLKEVRGAAATSGTWVWLLSRSTEAERTVFICQAPESNRNGPGFGGDVSGGSGL